MISFKRRIIYLFAILVLLLLITFFPKFIKKPGKVYDTVLMHVNREDITRLTFIHQDSSRIVVEKNSNGWWNIIEPFWALGDSEEIFGIVHTLTGMSVARRLPPEGTDLSEYGFNRPQGQFILENNKFSRPDTLIVGNKVPSGYQVYVKVNFNDTLYTVFSGLELRTQKTVMDLRYKKYWRVPHYDFDTLEFQRSNKTGFKLARDEKGSWVSLFPISSKIDNFKLQKVLDKFKSGETDSFTNENPENLAIYGLNRPALKIIAHLKGIAGYKVLEFAIQADGRVVARDSDRFTIFSIKQADWSQLNVNLNDLRAKGVVDFFNINDIDEMILQSEAVLLHYEKDSLYQWLLTVPNRQKGDLWKIDRIIEKVKNLEVQTFVQDAPKDLTIYGLKDPTLKISLKKNKETVVSLDFGKDVFRDTLVYLRKVTEPYIYTISQSDNIFFLNRVRELKQELQSSQ